MSLLGRHIPLVGFGVVSEPLPTAFVNERTIFAIIPFYPGLRGVHYTKWVARLKTCPVKK